MLEGGKFLVHEMRATGLKEVRIFDVEPLLDALKWVKGSRLNAEERRIVGALQSNSVLKVDCARIGVPHGIVVLTKGIESQNRALNSRFRANVRKVLGEPVLKIFWVKAAFGVALDDALAADCGWPHEEYGRKTNEMAEKLGLWKVE